ncbi:hypothetical protein ACDF64_17710 [Agromyces sp. MMS24-JH15]|uniref:hypothetical protein n=1 Tax=Agromyces sp. MMS24-JH15 TaxID=3243765 RepID=UPI00374973DA
MTSTTETLPPPTGGGTAERADTAPATGAAAGRGIRSIAFLTPGNYDDERPEVGLEETLRLFEYGERLGFDGA